jgi:hypothetical protein
VNPKVAPSVLVNNFKTVSSGLVRKEFAAGLRKIGGAPLSVLKQYVEGQAAVEGGVA